jgi:hypothetical protein
VEPTAATTTSCPRCGAPAAAGAPSCSSCGFVFFEAAAGPRLPRRTPLGLAIGALILAVAVAVALLVSRDDPEPAAPDPVSVAGAERRLERQLGFRDDDTAAVTCARSIRLGRQTRCQLRYANGDTQLILVALMAGGELDVEIPYPAQRRPGGRAERGRRP